MSFTLFTTPTGLDQLAVDLYMVSDTGQVTNTRQNPVVRHNETNRFWVIPHQSNIVAYINAAPDWAYRFNNFAASAVTAINYYRRFFVQRVELCARPLAAPSEQAFVVSTSSVSVGALPTSQIGISSSVINQIQWDNNGDAHSSYFSSAATFGAQPACLVVTAMSPAVLELSRQSLLAGGDGYVPLTAQLSSTVSASFAEDAYKPRFLTVTTIFSKPFSLTYQAVGAWR